MIIKNIKIILVGTIISFTMIGTASAGEHCGEYAHYDWGNQGSIMIFKKDLEAGTNVTGKCPKLSSSTLDDSISVSIEFTSKTRHAEWERYNGSIIGISGTIQYRDNGHGSEPIIYNPKIIWD